MSENKDNKENTNTKSNNNETNKDAESLLNSKASPVGKINSIEMGSDFLKQNISANNSFSDPNTNENNNKINNQKNPNNKAFLENQTSFTNPLQIPIQNNQLSLTNSSPYAVYYTNPENYQNHNYNYNNQAAAGGFPSYPNTQQPYPNNNQTLNYPQQQNQQSYYNYSTQEFNNAYYAQLQGIPQQNQALTSNYAAANLAAQSPFYYRLPQGSQAVAAQPQIQAQAQNSFPMQMQYQYQMPIQTQSLNQIPPAYAAGNFNNPHSIMQAVPNNLINPPLYNINNTNLNNKNTNIPQELNNNIMNENAQNQNTPLSPLNQPNTFPAAAANAATHNYIYPQNQQQQIQPLTQLYYNPNTFPANYQTSFLPPQANQIIPQIPTESEAAHGHINPYIKLLYNGGMACVAGVIAKLLTLNIHILESKNSIEHTQFPESYKKILRNFGSAKALAAIFPFSLSLVLWEYSKKTVDFIFRYDEKNFNEKYLSGKTDAVLYKNVYSRNFLASFAMGYLLAKPLNLFDSIILGVSHRLDVKGEKIDEKIIRQNIKDGYYEKFYNKLHNYSMTVYTMKFGFFFGFYDTIKFFNNYYRAHNFFVNFKLAFYVSMLTNFMVYPYEVARKKFAYELIYHNYKQLEAPEPIKKEPFFKEFKEIFKNSSYVFRDNSFRSFGYGMANKVLPSFFTAFAVAIYENYRY